MTNTNKTLDKYSLEKQAFQLAVTHDRLRIGEIKHYVYLGNYKGKDVFVNKITGLYLD